MPFEPFEPFGPRLEKAQADAGESAARMLEAMDEPDMHLLYQHACDGLSKFAFELHRRGVDTEQIMAQLHAAAVAVTCRALGIDS